MSNCSDGGIITAMLLRIVRCLIRYAFWLPVLVLLTGAAAPSALTEEERARAYTRPVEFEFITWELDALGVKFGQVALGTDHYLSEEARKEIVLQYLELVLEIWRTEYQLQQIYTDPGVADPQAVAEPVRQKLVELKDERSRLEPLAETILQDQLSTVAADLGLSLGGQALPPVLYRVTPPPSALIISRRDKVEQIGNISISAGLTVEDYIAIEESVDGDLNVSSLVVGIGGIGLYPTMVMETTDLNWLTNVVAHEWTHNFLTLRPLGVSYMVNPELRIMNETAASIAGNEISTAWIARYYPEFLPPPVVETPAPADTPTATPQPPSNEPPPFNFQAEMRETRITADQLLEEGKIKEAEEYMEARRRIFWDNGYRHIRKLNQAYFAFHGAYADGPGGGPAGKDVVGSAVRDLRAQSGSLADFLNRISWLSSFGQLQLLVGQP